MRERNSGITASPNQQSHKVSPGNASAKHSLDAQLQFLEEKGLQLATEMLQDNVVDENLTQEKIARVGIAVLKGSEGLVFSKSIIFDIARGMRLAE